MLHIDWLLGEYKKENNVNTDQGACCVMLEVERSAK